MEGAPKQLYNNLCQSTWYANTFLRPRNLIYGIANNILCFPASNIFIFQIQKSCFSFYFKRQDVFFFFNYVEQLSVLFSINKS